MKRQPYTSYKRVWFITGSSSGLGRALTEAILARGEQAVVTARTPELVRDLIERYPAQALVLELDVTRPDQVRSVVREAIERFGHIDVLVNNDGPSDGLTKEVTHLSRKVLTIESVSSNGHPPAHAAAVANDIIAKVDADSVNSAIR
jgi:NAD(P)-dependent dehydrogenase (short-subunit alcohol dehydrogenase family)